MRVHVRAWCHDDGDRSELDVLSFVSRRDVRTHDGRGGEVAEQISVIGLEGKIVQLRAPTTSVGARAF